MKVPVKRFKKPRPGEWVQPVMKNYLMKCCDCGLIHRMNFRVVISRSGMAKVQMQAFRG